jgi:hypothetical protein
MSRAKQSSTDHDHKADHHEHHGDREGAAHAASRSQRTDERHGSARRRQDIQGRITAVKDDGDECHIEARFNDPITYAERYMMYESDAFLMFGDFASRLSVYSITTDDQGRPIVKAVTTVGMTHEMMSADVVFNPSSLPKMRTDADNLRTRIVSRVIVTDRTPVARDGAIVEEEDTKVRVTLGTGAIQGVTAGMTAVLMKGGKPIRGGTFSLDRVNPKRCSGMVDLIPDQVDQCDEVRINPG